MARWVRRRDRAGRVLALANQKRGVLARYGVTRTQADRAAWTVDREGRLEGAAAVNRVWRGLGGASQRVPAPAGGDCRGGGLPLVRSQPILLPSFRRPSRVRGRWHRLRIGRTAPRGGEVKFMVLAGAASGGSPCLSR